MKNKVSIIVPIYNVEIYVEKCLKSLINQTFTNIEILAISDGSPDNSMKIVEKYAKKDKRIKPIYKDNGGYGSVLEYAIDMIDSKYFLICDPDDWMNNDTIELLFNIAEKNHSDLVVGDMFMTYSTNDCDKYYKCCHRNYVVQPNKKIIDKNEIGYFAFMGCSPHSKLFLTEKAKGIKFPHKISYTDTLLYLVFLNRCDNVYYIDKPLSYYFFNRPGNTANDLNKISYSKKTFNAQIIVLEETFNQVKQDGNGYILYRLYSEAISILRKIKYIENKSEMIECKKRLYKFIKELLPYKKNIYKCIYENDTKIKIVKVLVFKLLTNRLTTKLVYEFLIVLKIKNKRESSHE